jgi:hypothetical protein
VQLKICSETNQLLFLWEAKNLSIPPRVFV